MSTIVDATSSITGCLDDRAGRSTLLMRYEDTVSAPVTDINSLLDTERIFRLDNSNEFEVRYTIRGSARK